ncbi:MAG: 23S rRNA (guanosine(2251)-2'-O)-methyltransferase RlmB [Bacteroidales bacterium]|nr:23S rRNA (guanosine(2251)-2'-O)-methyltransferase RlmB [Bacteroidales bacterium]
MIAPSSNKNSKTETKDNLVICGIRPVMEALAAGRTIDKVMLQNGLFGQLLSELKVKLHEAGVPVQFVPVEKLNRTTKANHQGVVALISPISYHSFANMIEEAEWKSESPMMVMLDHVTDVRNLGAIARSAECAGIEGIIVPKHGSAQIGDEAVKSSSGALLRVPVCREDNLKSVIHLARQSGWQVCAATEKCDNLYTNIDFHKPTILVMGAEETGISNELMKLCNERAKLPMKGEVQSLNVSVAAALFFYEALRQKTE